MSSIKSVVVIGASGNVGRETVKALLDANFRVTALTRESSDSKFPENVEISKTDYSPESLKTVFSGKDAVVSTIGFEGYKKQFEVVKAAVAAGVKRYIPSEFGNTREKKSIDVFEQILIDKVQVLNLVKKMAAENKDFTWSALATGPFFDQHMVVENFVGRPGVFGVSLKNRSVEIYDSGSETVYSTTLTAIGKAVAEILRKPEDTANKFLAIYNVKTTQNEILAGLEEITGEKWKVTNTSTSEALRRGSEGFAKGDVTAFFDILAADMLEDGAGRGILKGNGKYDNELLGVYVEDMKTVLKDLLAAA